MKKAPKNISVTGLFWSFALRNTIVGTIEVVVN
jgi:hypothetical protein